MIGLKGISKVRCRDHGTALEDEILSLLRIGVTCGHELVEMDVVNHVAAEGPSMWKKPLTVAQVSRAGGRLGVLTGGKAASTTWVHLDELIDEIIDAPAALGETHPVERRRSRALDDHEARPRACMNIRLMATESCLYQNRTRRHALLNTSSVRLMRIMTCSDVRQVNSHENCKIFMNR